MSYEFEVIEFDNSSHNSSISVSVEETTENIIDNISCLINDIEKYSDTTDTNSSKSDLSNLSNELWTDIYQKKTGITEDELHQLINEYKEFFDNEKLTNEKRMKLVKLIKNMISVSTKIK